MSEFKVNLSGLDKEISNLTNYSNNIKNIHTQFEQIRESLRKDHSEFLIIASHILRTIDEEILNEAAKMGKLSEALGYIVEKYNDCESGIVNSDLTKSTSSSRESNTEQNNSSEENIFERFIDCLKESLGWEEQEARTVTLKMEHEHDVAMQREILALMRTDEFSPGTWYHASVKERKEILKKFLIQLNFILGLNVPEKIIFGKKGPAGQYETELNSVWINKEELSGKDSYQTMYIMIHEMRHAYQWAAIHNPDSYMVTSETIAQWENNWTPENYIEGSVNFDGYVSQPIEWDAMNFAFQEDDFLINANPQYRGGW